MKIKQSELHGLVGCSRQAVSKLKKEKKLFFDENGFLITRNKTNKIYLSSKGIDPKTGKALDVKKEIQKVKDKPKKKRPAPKKKTIKNVKKGKLDAASIKRESKTDFSIMSRIPERMLGMTIKELILSHGSIQELKSYVDVLDKMMSAARKDVDIQERRKNLLPRSLMEFMFQYLEVLHNQIFNYAKSSTDDIISISLADAKKARKKIPEMMLNDLSKLVKESKKNIQRELRKFENSMDGEEE